MPSPRRAFVSTLVVPLVAAASAAGCRATRFSRIIEPGDRLMTGSHQAGQETFRPLVNESVAKLLARHCGDPVRQVSFDGVEVVPPPRRRICFVGVENASAEDIGDFKEQVFEIIDQRILDSQSFESINRRAVDAALRETRSRPDELLIPERMRAFAATMESQGHPIDFLLYARLTSGTTRSNRDEQRDYLLTLELVDVRTGTYDKQSAELSKGYHHSRLSRWLATTLRARP
jgi:hypothetical protein